MHSPDHLSDLPYRVWHSTCFPVLLSIEVHRLDQGRLSDAVPSFGHPDRSVLHSLCRAKELW